VIGPRKGTRCSGLFLNIVRPMALLAVLFSVAALAITGCASTGEGPKAGLTSPATGRQEDSYSDDAIDAIYQPPRSPGFNELAGG
jgi:hypothetical protein